MIMYFTCFKFFIISNSSNFYNKKESRIKIHNYSKDTICINQSATLKSLRTIYDVLTEKTM